jgi:uncharacterized spore protein YtfJ
VNGLAAGAPLAVGERTLVPVVRAWVRGAPAGGGAWAAGGKEPVAVVVRDAGGTRALDLEGGEADLAALLETVEGLAAALGVTP